MTNHTLRELELERLRGDWQRVLSVGANGSWYFEWFRGAVGDVGEHIGLEAYLPEPDDLPDYVTWIANSAHRMDDVDTGSVDLVFAGQVSEHMWPEELAGFLAEAHRVLRPGGTLALDSPNRLVTQHLDWSHGEHTIELDRHEIGELLEMAGFDVVSVAGMWRCRIDGRLSQLEEGLDIPEVVTRRIAGGREHPDESFCWWVNAERTARAVDRAALDRRVAELFVEHWNTRISRGLFPGVGLDLPVVGRVAAATLPFPLRAGDWKVTLRLASGSADVLEAARLAFVAPGGEVVHSLVLADAAVDPETGSTLSWTVAQPHLLFALVVELEMTVRGEASIAFPLEIEPI